MWKTAFKKCKGGMVCFRFFKGCLPQVLLGPFLNTLSHIYRTIVLSKNILHYQRQYCFVKWLFLWFEKSKVWWSPTFLLPQNRISLWKKSFGSLNIPSKKEEFRTVIEIFKIRTVKILWKNPFAWLRLLFWKLFKIRQRFFLTFSGGIDMAHWL